LPRGRGPRGCALARPASLPTNVLLPALPDGLEIFIVVLQPRPRDLGAGDTRLGSVHTVAADHGEGVSDPYLGLFSVHVRRVDLDDWRVPGRFFHIQ
jgi:hypothetical protein